MRTMILGIFLVLALISPAPSEDTTAMFMKADELLILCTSTDKGALKECAGFLQGVSDELNIWRGMENRPVCKEPVKLFEVRDVVVQFIKTHPVKNEGAASLAHVAIVTAWCPG
jgi:Rap1a immunity proteins